MQIHESAENYLETILMLSKKLPVVRSVDIANLREGGKITVTQAGYIYLTDSGREIAEMIYERHEWLRNWLISLGVDSNIAAEDACKMEHVISKESFEALKNHFGQF